ncbi:hypothetical protein BJX99DRAFT_257623 [Aspergillus californicus]
MCYFWQTQYLCACIHDHSYIPCTLYTHQKATPQEKRLGKTRNPNIPCHTYEIEVVHDWLTFCEDCYGDLETQIRRDGLKKTLETAPLRAELGVVLFLMFDEEERKRIFAKSLASGEGEVLLTWEWIQFDKGENLRMVRPVEVPDSERRVGRSRKGAGEAAWKYM